MIEYNLHKQLVIATGASEETFKAQRDLMQLSINNYIHSLKRCLRSIPEIEFRQPPDKLRELFIKLLEDMK